jgi:hypothetical protein
VCVPAPVVGDGGVEPVGAAAGVDLHAASEAAAAAAAAASENSLRLIIQIPYGEESFRADLIIEASPARRVDSSIVGGLVFVGWDVVEPTV